MTTAGYLCSSVCNVVLYNSVSSLFIRYTLVWQATKFSVFFSVSGYRYLGNGGTDRRKLSHDDTYESWIRLDVSSPPQGDPQIEILSLNLGHLTANISKTVSRSITC